MSLADVRLPFRFMSKTRQCLSSPVSTSGQIFCQTQRKYYISLTANMHSCLELQEKLEALWPIAGISAQNSFLESVAVIETTFENLL